MNGWHFLALGAGILIGWQLRAPESACCATVARAVRDKFPGPAQSVGDLLGAWGPLGGVVAGLELDRLL